MTRRRRSAAVVAAFAVAAVAAVLVLVRLGEPPGIVFDETYYVPDARAMMATGVDEAFAVHPPLGKWVIAAGIALAGDGPVGWRLGGALLGVLTVAATVELGRRLTGRVGFGVAAGVLVVTDGVWLTTSRLAMLDAPLAALVTLGTLALVVDHRRATSVASDVVAVTGRDVDGVSARRSSAPTVSRWPLLLAGALFGAAAATKWSGLLALGGAGLLAAGWELAARRRRASPGDRRPVLVAAARPVALAMVVVPAAVYAVAWAPWLAGYPASSTAAEDCAEVVATGQVCDPSVGERVRGVVRHHAAVWRFHRGLDADHPYRAPATTWPTQYRPVVAFYERCDADGLDGDGAPCRVAGPQEAAEVVILGNPALWWSALVTVPLAAVALRRREATAVVPLTMLAAQFVPWLIVARPVFNFYTAPLVPLVAVTAVVAGAELDRPGPRRWALAAAALVGAVGAGVALSIGAAVPSALTVAVVLATVGAAIGGCRDRAPRSGGGSRRAGTVVVTIVVVAAVAAAIHLAPVWLAVPLDDAALRSRWWLPSWV